MVVQIRRDTFRVIRQHDHALASGALAAAWVGRGERPDPLPLEAVLGVALHDCAWLPVDAVPRRDPSSGGILSFLEHPRGERRRFYASGVDDAERIHPYAGLLASLHYSGFERGESSLFEESERARQERLIHALALDDDGRARLARHRRFVSLFDDLSLFACLAGPRSLARPEWLLPGDAADVPGGLRLRLDWRDEETVTVEPFPFRGTVELRIPARDLPRVEYADDDAVRSAWEEAAPLTHRTRFIAASLEPDRVNVLR